MRAATASDGPSIGSILMPIIRQGETYALPRTMPERDALAYWCDPSHEVWLAEDGDILGTYMLRANHPGGGDHVANCGYMTATHAQRKGVARAMLEHSLSRARQRGFLAMQFNFVVSTNQRAINTWTSYGFREVGRLPSAFRHPTLGLVDALVMYKSLS